MHASSYWASPLQDLFQANRDWSLNQRVSWKDRWLEAVAPDEPHKLKRRLDWDELSETGFEQWLYREVRDKGELLPWRQALDDCRTALRASWDIPLLAVAAEEHRPFIDLWWPIRDLASSRLAAELNSLADSIDVDGDVYNQLADCLLDRLCAIGEQVLWDSFRTGLSPGAMLLAHLGVSADGTGPPVREQYGEFIRGHRRDGLSALLREFPELGRFIGSVFVLWLQGSEEMLRRVSSDRDVLKRVFSVPAGHRLCTVRQGLSDPHRGGRAVVILCFSSTDGDQCIRVVYKPKDMGVDAAYHALLHDLNVCSDLPPLRNLAIHAGDGYGYMEYVLHRLCSDEAELQRFYGNAGRLTALLHWLGCTDCHHENLIACADQLLLIDTETLLEPDRPDHIRDASTDAAGPALSRLQQRVQRSVLRSGLLPQWMFLGDAKQPVDISALGISSPGSDEQPVAGWLGINSDGMMPGRVIRTAEIPTSLPVGVGVSNPFQRHLDAFCAGFQRQSNVLIALRQTLLTRDGPLTRFAGLPRRIVLRATRVYFAVQRKMLETASLRSPFAQALRLEQLARSFLLAEARPLHWPVFAAERQQMQQLDIPFFTHAIDGEALNLDDAGGKLSGFIQSSGLASARDRLQQLDPEEIAFQLRLIRGVVQARQLRVADDASPASAASSPSETISSSSAANGLEAAARIARHLSDLAIHDPQGQVEWLGMDLGADGKSFAYGPVGTSLYGGAIGIACLLERLQNRPESPPEVHTLLAAILQPLRELVEQASDEKRTRWWRDQPLGLGGCGGQLSALQQLGEMALVDVLVDAARPRFLEADHQLDLLGGCAGLIGPLLRANSDAARRLALHAGDHLLKHQGEDGGWGSGGNGRPVLGFSHGTAGYAAALAQLHRVTGEDRFRTGAVAALTLERSRFCKEEGNWPDYRGSHAGGEDCRFRVGWCSGAPGIALGRACLWSTDLWDEICEQEIAIAIDTTATTPDLGTDHLCCGNLGLMLLLELLCEGPWPLSSDVRGRAYKAINRYRSQALQRCSDRQVSLRCFGTREGTLTLPGFFTGLSGMGMALLEDQQSRAVTASLVSAGLWPLG